MSQKLLHKWLRPWLRRDSRRRLAGSPLPPAEVLEIREMKTADMGGNSLASATELGTLSGSRQVADFVGRSDVNDYFRFRLNERSNVRLDLSGLAADADLQLLNGNGSVLASSTRGGTSSELISRTLEAGTYAVRVYRYSGDTSYRLTMTATPNSPAAPDYAGNSLSSARELGTVNGTQSYADFVGRLDTDDFYRFQLGSQSSFELWLSELQANANVQVLNSSGGLIAEAAQGGTSMEYLRLSLNAGRYFVRVTPSGDAETNYRLTLRTQPETPPDNAGNTLSQARNLGTLGGTINLSEYVGQSDRADFYRFRVSGQSNFRLRLDGLSADADVNLMNSGGQVLASSTLGGSNPETIVRLLGEGDYFVQVYPYGNANTNYNLSLTVTPTAPATRSMDVSTMTPIADYGGHLGADYMGEAGTAVLSPVNGWVREVRPVDGYGTMAVAIDVVLPNARVFATELSGSFLSTDRVVVIFGHLRPSRELVANSDPNVRFEQGRNELGYGVGSYITVGQRLGYIETHGYEGTGSTGSHIHVTASDANSGPANIWQGRGLPEDDPRRGRYIRPELAWPNLR